MTQGKDMMMRKVIIITGGAGLLGSHLLLALFRTYEVVSIDKRPPSNELITAAPGIQWVKLDISNFEEVDAAFQNIISERGHIDYVIHLAAYYHFGNDWRKEYETTNINGSEHVIKSAIKYKAGRIIFSSSVAALEPKCNGNVINEESTASSYIPYAKSKLIGEQLFKRASESIPVVIIRFAGIFTDWCELPPLSSMIRLWLSSNPLSVVIPGKGKSGIPYIHITDAVNFIEECLNSSTLNKSFQVLIASQIGTVLQKDLYKTLKGLIAATPYKEPVLVPVWIARFGLRIRIILGRIFSRPSFEQPWMLNYIDHPWIVDNRYTQETLNWHPTPNLDLIKRIKIIITHFREDKRRWIERNSLRNLGLYSYAG